MGLHHSPRGQMEGGGLGMWRCLTTVLWRQRFHCTFPHPFVVVLLPSDLVCMSQGWAPTIVHQKVNTAEQHRPALNRASALQWRDVWSFYMPGIESVPYLGLSEHCWTLDNDKFTFFFFNGFIILKVNSRCLMSHDFTVTTAGARIREILVLSWFYKEDLGSEQPTDLSWGKDSGFSSLETNPTTLSGPSLRGWEFAPVLPWDSHSQCIRKLVSSRNSNGTTHVSGHQLAASIGSELQVGSAGLWEYGGLLGEMGGGSGGTYVHILDS